MPISVMIAGQQGQLAGVNIRRDTHALVMYTPAQGERTGTNQYGAEVVVVGGKVTGYTNAIGNQVIPRNGYVLSGHGISMAWLMAWAAIGAVVSISGVATEPGPTPAPTPIPVVTRSGFVTRNGRTLMLDGKPYKFVGFNAFGIQGCEGRAWTRAQMDSYFSELPPNSMTRFWASAMYGVAILDQLVWSAEAHNQKLIFTLNNDLNDCVDDGAKNNSWYTSGYKTSGYLGWATRLATRYKDSPAVGLWEAINEAGQAQGEGRLDGTTMKNFYQDVASTIKRTDPNHLVGGGDNAEFNYSGGYSAYQTAYSGPAIDVLSLHDYESDYGGSSVTSTHFAGLKKIADGLNKPIILGEMNDSAARVGKSARAVNVQKSIQAYLTAGASGCLIWNRSMTTYADGEGYNIIAGDPLIDIIRNWTF